MQCIGSAEDPASLFFEALQCSCENGISEVDNCPGGAVEMCASCFNGYHLVGDLCEIDVCACVNGVAATGSTCPLHETTFCESCNLGYSIISTNLTRTMINDCSINVCLCENGNAAIGENCPEPDFFLCETCDAAFHNETGVIQINEIFTVTCENNICSCENGTASTGSNCVHGSEHCESCFDDSFYMDDESVCGQKKCSCTNGTAVESVDCVNHLENDCMFCDLGYHLASSGVRLITCEENICVCDHGANTVGTACSVNLSQFCASCDEGYELNENNECIRGDFECWCPYGNAEFECITNGIECSACSTGLAEGQFDNAGGFCVDSDFDNDWESEGCAIRNMKILNIPEQNRIYSSVRNNDETGTGYARSMIGSEQTWSADVSGSGQAWSRENEFGVPIIENEEWIDVQWMVLDLGTIDETTLVGLAIQGSAISEEYVNLVKIRSALRGTTDFNTISLCDKTVQECPAPDCELCAEATTSNLYGAVLPHCLCPNVGNIEAGYAMGYQNTHTGGAYTRFTGPDLSMNPENQGYANSIQLGFMNGTFFNGQERHEQALFNKPYSSSDLQFVQVQVYKWTGAPAMRVGILICGECPEGYFEDENNTCWPKICTCSNGVESVAENCLWNGSEFCQSCDSGFTLANGVCIDSSSSTAICTCENGVGAVGFECPETEMNYCRMCYYGYVLHDNVCRLNHYSCPEDGGCISCDAGFVLLNGDCVYYSYNCPGCASCELGYTLSNGFCIMNNFSGESCPTGYYLVDGVCMYSQYYSESCETGYVQINGVCIFQQYSCNGCISCPSGYVFSNGICLYTDFPGTGSCPEGYVHSDGRCVYYSYPGGDSCPVGYVLENGFCIWSNYDCFNCSSCENGFLLLNGVCFHPGSEVCNCQNGTAAVVSTGGCPQDGSEYCTTCENGYFNADGLCHISYQTCQNGCESCPVNYILSNGICVFSHYECPLQNGCFTCDDGYTLSNGACYLSNFGCQGDCGENDCPVGYINSDGLCHYYIQQCLGNNCLTCPSPFILKNGVCYYPHAQMCSCYNGVASYATECPNNGLEHCSYCNSGFELFNGFCLISDPQPSVCDCQNGIGAVAENCPQNDAQFCRFCDSGFSLINYACLDLQNPETKICTCNNGYGAFGDDCPQTGVEKCRLCNAGYDFSNSLCTFSGEEVCACRNGLGHVGDSCPQNGIEFCESCHTGFDLISPVCVDPVNDDIRVCTCENGIGANGLSCPRNGLELCVFCYSGTVLMNDKCVNPTENICICTNGLGATGDDCPQNNLEFCEICNSGFILSNGICFELASPPALCSCENGIGGVNENGVGEKCPVNGAEFCVFCYSGFSLINGLCVVSGTSACTCDNGIGAVGNDCPANGTEFCRLCDVSFDLSNGVCSSNSCSCQNGTSSIEENCPENGLEHCELCDPNHVLVNNLCFEAINGTFTGPVCSCNNGVGTVAENCPENGSEFCRFCDSQFSLLTTSNGNDICEFSPTCLCSNGNAVNSENCPQHGLEYCASCELGYILLNGQCFNPLDGPVSLCTCDNGIGAVGNFCPQNGLEFCVLCNPSYTLSNGVCSFPGTETCFCSFGVASTGENCPVNGIEYCSSCYLGFNLVNGICVDPSEPVCSCQNGVGTVGTEVCPANGFEYCASCDSGYSLINGICVNPNENSNICFCTNGVGAVGDVCPSSGSEFCMFCEQDYVLVNGLCDFPNTLSSTCSNGHLVPESANRGVSWSCFEDADFIVYGHIEAHLDRNLGLNRDEAHDFCQSIDNSGRSVLAQIRSDNERSELFSSQISAQNLQIDNSQSAWTGGYTYGDGVYYSDGMGVVDNNVLLRESLMNYFFWNSNAPDHGSPANGESIDRACIKTNMVLSAGWDDYSCCDVSQFTYCEIRFCKTCTGDTSILPVVSEPVAQSPKCQTCPVGYSANVGNTCVRNVYPTTSTPAGSLELGIETLGNFSVRLVSGESACSGPMSGRVEVKYKNELSNLPEFTGIAEINDDTWFTVQDNNFDAIVSENLCKAFFGYGSSVDETLYNTQCGTSESRTIRFGCPTLAQPFYNGEFQEFYSFNYPTHENIYPNGCEIESVNAGCSFEGCELSEPEGFPFNSENEEHVALSCACIDGYSFDGNLCARTEIVPTETPIGNFGEVVREVNTTSGKLRLVKSSGPCLGKEMSGRVEYQAPSDFDITQFQPNLDIQEIQQDMWFSIHEDGFANSPDDFSNSKTGEYVCQTLYGEFAKIQEFFPYQQCGTTNARYWKFTCGPFLTDLNQFVQVNDMNYPNNCTYDGPYAGCDEPGCELPVPYGFPFIFDVDHGATLQHAALECGCIIGYELNSEKTECIRTVYPTTSTPIGSVQLETTGNFSIRLVPGEGVCQSPMSGRVEVNYNGNLSSLPEFDGILEINENTWFTIQDGGFDTTVSENICKSFFGYGSSVQQFVHNSGCGTSDSRTIKFDCPALSKPFYNGEFQEFYSFNSPTHDNIYPYTCDIESINAGCSQQGCELPDQSLPGGFSFAQAGFEHAAVICECNDGYEFDGSVCVRIQIVPTETPVEVLREVETSAGKLRLVGGVGTCNGKEMSGRVEYQVASDFDITQFQPDLEIQEIQQDMWFSIHETEFLNSRVGEYVCQTLYGEFANIQNFFTNTQCGASEARYWKLACGPFSTDTNQFTPVNDLNYPNNCTHDGPYAGCITPGCELPNPYGFPFNSAENTVRS